MILVDRAGAARRQGRAGASAPRLAGAAWTRFRLRRRRARSGPTVIDDLREDADVHRHRHRCRRGRRGRRPRATLKRLAHRRGLSTRPRIALGASIACAGLCLTVVARRARAATAAAGSTSMPRPRPSPAPRSAPGGRAPRINLERSLQDRRRARRPHRHRPCRRRRRDRRREDLDRRPGAHGALRLPRAARARAFIAEKGSVALDGTSLTVNDVEGDVFSVLHDPAHARGHHLGRAPGRATASTSRSTSWRATPPGLRSARTARAYCTLPHPGIRGCRIGRALPVADVGPHRSGDTAAGPGSAGARILVVEARFYDDIADELLTGATGRHRGGAGASVERPHRAGRPRDPGRDRHRPRRRGSAAAALRRRGGARLRHPRRDQPLRHRRRRERPRPDGPLGRPRPAARQRHPDRRERRAGAGARQRRRDEQGRRRGRGGARHARASSAASMEA